MRSFSDDPPEGIGKKRAAPEFQALARRPVSPDVSELVPHAVHHAYENAVGNGMGALDGAPRVVLGRAELGFLLRMPADGRGIKQDARALQGGQPRAFRIPLVPADQRANAKALKPRSPGVK